MQTLPHDGQASLSLPLPVCGHNEYASQWWKQVCRSRALAQHLLSIYYHVSCLGLVCGGNPTQRRRLLGQATILGEENRKERYRLVFLPAASQVLAKGRRHGDSRV